MALELRTGEIAIVRSRELKKKGSLYSVEFRLKKGVCQSLEGVQKADGVYKGSYVYTVDYDFVNKENRRVKVGLKLYCEVETHQPFLQTFEPKDVDHGVYFGYKRYTEKFIQKRLEELITNKLSSLVDLSCDEIEDRDLGELCKPVLQKALKKYGLRLTECKVPRDGIAVAAYANAEILQQPAHVAAFGGRPVRAALPGLEKILIRELTPQKEQEIEERAAVRAAVSGNPVLFDVWKEIYVRAYLRGSDSLSDIEIDQKVPTKEREQVFREKLREYDAEVVVVT